MSEEFLLELDSISDINVLETMREGLATRSHTAELTWQERNIIYEKIQAIVCRIMQLEQDEIPPISSPKGALCVAPDPKGPLWVKWSIPLHPLKFWSWLHARNNSKR
ncbi:hypothetical protein [Brevibacillus sp. NRS-1366]|uniref:hypothetical protein n=1 Tax=Brevibacillus sp. NRS-1366 TaxID=3233899 RepID=UPI003D20CD76